MNAFEALGEQQIVAPRKARMRAAEKRRATAEEKTLAERDNLFRLWKHWRRERVEALLAGPHGDAARELMTFLEVMKLTDGTELIERVRTAGWNHTDPDTRFEILSLINTGITALRERAGLPPFDDALPDEEPTTFIIIREMFR